MQGVRVLALDLGLLIAGSKERGEVENRVTDMVATLQATRADGGPRTILMIDEIHNLVGAGAAPRGGVVGAQGLDIANMLKPALGKGLQCIGATTLGEYRARFERDAALTRRFQPVIVREPSSAQALQVRLRTALLGPCTSSRRTWRHLWAAGGMSKCALQ